MKGFSDHVLMIFPDWELYENMTDMSRSLLDQSLTTIQKYVTACGMEIHCLNSDITATQLYTVNPVSTAYAPTTENVIWRAGFCTEDLSFARNNIDNMSMARTPEYDDDTNDRIKRARSEFPTKRGISIEDRFYIVLDRCKFLASSEIAKTKFVITFEDRNKEVFKVKEGEFADGRMIWRISAKTGYRLEAFLSGERTNLKQFIEYDRLYDPVYKWHLPSILRVS